MIHVERRQSDVKDHETRTFLSVLQSPVALLVVAGLLLRLAFALLPAQMHFMLLEDDAWMVTAIARHWALGHGITADGVSPTNGFHPLYPLTLGALPYLLRPDDLDSGFRANVIITALLNTLALLPLSGLLHLVARRSVALAGLAVVALNPFFIRVSVNAMETSLALLLLLSLWWYALAREPGRAEVTGGVILGVLAGLAGLARLDTLVAVGLLGLVLAWREVMERRCIPIVSGSYAATAGLVLLPYFARNLLVFGNFSPSSGRALSYMHSYRESFAFTSGLQLAAYQPAIDLTWAPPWVLLLVVAWLAGMVLTIPSVQRRMLAPLLLYTVAITFYYAYLQQQGSPRYYVAVGVVVVVLVCAWADRLLGRIVDGQHTPQSPPLVARLPLLVMVGVVVLNTGMFLSHVTTLQNAPYLAQPSMYQAARWIATNLPPEARLAAQNSGVFQYYSEHMVLNIDGKLNNEIIPVLEKRQLDNYLRSKDIAYIVDLPGVSDYIEFYSSNMSEAPAHHEMSSLGKLFTYARLVAAKLGLGAPVQLDVREPQRVLHPFEAFSTIVRVFPLPNDPSQGVTIYRLAEDFGK